MMITEKQILAYSHVPTSEIKQDIKRAQEKIDASKITASKSMVSKRTRFINRMKQVLAYRKK